VREEKTAIRVFNHEPEREILAVTVQMRNGIVQLAQGVRQESEQNPALMHTPSERFFQRHSSARRLDVWSPPQLLKRHVMVNALRGERTTGTYG
jgi:hypothetical protein